MDEEGAMPSERLRQLEVEANNAFDQYREMYVTWFVIRYAIRRLD